MANLAKLKFYNHHLHTHYSVMDSVIRPDQLVDELHKRKHKYVTITEHGSLASTYELWDECNKRDITPILGCECYFVDDYKYANAEVPYNYGHITVICMNEVGWRNLKKLHHIAWEKGYMRKPRIQLKDLYKYNEGLIVTSGCMRGVIGLDYLDSDKFHKGDPKRFRNARVRKRVQKLKKVFGDRFYIEVQLLEIPEQIKLTKYILYIADKYDIDIIVTGDSHYLEKGDTEIHDAMICIGRHEKLNDPNNSTYTTSQLWLKTAKELNRARKRWYRDLISEKKLVTYIRNAKKLAKRIERYPIRTEQSALPVFSKKPDKLLNDICYSHRDADNLLEREEYWDRYQYEHEIIRRLGFTNYFLVVWDITKYARSNNIPYNARGSVCGSLIAYLMGITWIDPLRFDLPFERFLTEDRLSLPDIDMDFSSKDKDSIVKYCEEKYGEECVVHICNYLRWKPKQALKDVGRALDYDYQTLNNLTRKVTENIAEWEEFAIKPGIQEFLSAHEDIAHLSERMLKIIRQQGIHASGVVVTPGPCVDWLPVSYRTDKSKEENKLVKVTEWDMYALEALDILKLDFLGVNQLDIVQEAINLINRRHSVEFKNIDDLQFVLLQDSYHDEKVYELIEKQHTVGTFQLGTSDGMRALGKDLRPDNIHEVIAMISLYRTAVLEAGMHKEYVERKFGKKIRYLHPKMEHVLMDTRGVMLYQEQCVTGDVLIKTPFGDVPIRELVEKREINQVFCVNSDGDICVRKILAFHDNGKKEVFELELDNGKKLKCTEDHRVLTERGWIPANQLEKDDEIICT